MKLSKRLIKKRLTHLKDYLQESKNYIKTNLILS